MASIKVKFRPSDIAGREGTVFYQLIHERKVRQILSDCHVLSAEWDGRRSAVVDCGIAGRLPFILSVRERIRWDLERLHRIDSRLEERGVCYTVDDIVDEFQRYSREYTLFNYMESIMARLRQNGRFRTAETYRATLNNIRKFREGEDIMLDSLSAEVMESYEGWLRKRGLAPNTISFYTRILRAVYNRAVEDRITEDRAPFRHVYTGIDRTVKRALPIRLIKKLRKLDLAGDPKLEYARDMFMMSFYLRGMSFIDMAFLRKTDLRCGYVVYRRHKTGQQLTIAWTKEMQQILDRYPENESPYLLPIIRKRATDERAVYKSAAYAINRSLKKIAPEAGVKIPLTMYVARHSWASAAKAKGIPVSVISEGMGHDSEATTRIYLASLDTSAVDRANTLILKSLD